MYRINISLLISAILISSVNSLSKPQLKNSMKLLKKSCMGKHDVTEELIGNIEGGQFIKERNVMCYIACIYQMSQIVKNNKLNYEASIKQVDLMYPPEMKKPVKAAIEKCKEVSPKYKDLCESSFHTAKCIYEADPKNFIFA